MTTAVVEPGQVWRQTDGYMCRVVGFAQNGWPCVRHVNAKYAAPSMINPAWFGEWELIRKR